MTQVSSDLEIVVVRASMEADSRGVHTGRDATLLFNRLRDTTALPEAFRFRHKRYEPDNGIDFSWEREWRVRTDALGLDPSQATLVVPNRAWSDCLYRQHADGLRTDAYQYQQYAWSEIDKYPWHFIALEDLGVVVDFRYAPP